MTTKKSHKVEKILSKVVTDIPTWCLSLKERHENEKGIVIWRQGTITYTRNVTPVLPLKNQELELESTRDVCTRNPHTGRDTYTEWEDTLVWNGT